MMVQTKEVLEAMRSDTEQKEVDCIKVDGGASNNDLLMQIQADYLQVVPSSRKFVNAATELNTCWSESASPAML